MPDEVFGLSGLVNSVALLPVHPADGTLPATFRRTESGAPPGSGMRSDAALPDPDASPAVQSGQAEDCHCVQTLSLRSCQSRHAGFHLLERVTLVRPLPQELFQLVFQPESGIELRIRARRVSSDADQVF